MSDLPIIYQDRVPLAVLGKHHPDILSMLDASDKGKTGLRDSVHFCGLAHVSAGSSVFFLPRSLSESGETAAHKLAFARLTMKVMLRYGRETASRTGLGAEDGDRSSLVTVVEDIASDFFRYGIYSERTRIRGRNSGKPDWKRTIQSEIPLISADGDVVYTELRTSRSLDTHDNPLSRIQAAILREILLAHSWWLDGPAGAGRQLLQFNLPIVPRALWKHSLKSLLPGLYANRPVSLVRSLLRYLDEMADETSGSFLSGVEDFERIWEEMLRQTLEGVEHGWNARLPKPVYSGPDEKLHRIGGGMEMDIVTRQGNALIILDAKYYGANGTGSVPGTGDIVKQLMYQMTLERYLEKVGRNETVSNAFVFPAGESHKKPFVSAGLAFDEALDGEFPAIRIIYQDIEAVMKAYAGRYKLGPL